MSDCTIGTHTLQEWSKLTNTVDSRFANPANDPHDYRKEFGEPTYFQIHDAIQHQLQHSLHQKMLDTLPEDPLKAAIHRLHGLHGRIHQLEQDRRHKNNRRMECLAQAKLTNTEFRYTGGEQWRHHTSKIHKIHVNIEALYALAYSAYEDREAAKGPDYDWGTEYRKEKGIPPGAPITRTAAALQWQAWIQKLHSDTPRSSTDTVEDNTGKNVIRILPPHLRQKARRRTTRPKGEPKDTGARRAKRARRPRSPSKGTPQQDIQPRRQVHLEEEYTYEYSYEYSYSPSPERRTATNPPIMAPAPPCAPTQAKNPPSKNPARVPPRNKSSSSSSSSSSPSSSKKAAPTDTKEELEPDFTEDTVDSRDL